MKINIIVSAFLLFINFASSQDLNGYVEYSLIFGEDEKLSTGEFGNYFKQAKENASYLSFFLEFNKSEMCFYAKAQDVDGVDTSFSYAFSGINGKYYKKANETSVLNAIDDYVLGKIILSKDMKLDWNLQNETKKIQDFICYKATSTIHYNNGVGDFKKEIVVWYCPKIPYSYGPKGYGNLPGIILEYQENNIVIGAKKIVFNKETKIETPKGKLITEKEYNELLQKNFENQKD